ATYFASVHDYYQRYIEILMQLHRQHPDQGFDRQALEASEKSKVRSLLDMLANADCKTPTQSPASAEAQSSSDCRTAPVALTSQQVQALIQSDDAVLLEYALGSDASYLWVADQQGISSYRLPGAEQILALTTRFRTALLARQLLPNEDAEQSVQRVTRGDRIINPLGQELSRMLLGPASNSLRTKKRIVIVPDGPLQYIPFAALPISAEDTTRNS